MQDNYNASSVHTPYVCSGCIALTGSIKDLVDAAVTALYTKGQIIKDDEEHSIWLPLLKQQENLHNLNLNDNFKTYLKNSFQQKPISKDKNCICLSTMIDLYNTAAQLRLGVT